MKARKRARRLAEITCAAAVALLSASGCGGGSDGDDSGNDGGGASDDGGPGSNGDGGGEEEIASCVETSGTRLKKVVLDHGGEVRVDESDLGGAAIVIRLPLFVAEAEA